ncbi:CPBP family intramembrane glutamic endopeptidase [Natrialba aegyptia]|uniref:CPBP family intramembrane glutamic endopeptidase n=1 Tax=Natrialba aegyptia TaxID=129789 RepID=UPI000677FFE2|nr:CPBP family intramembrane glutamic endopeptidase [Natrialba aegyptia]
MVENGYRSVVAVTRLPPLTIGNLALALFGLPLVVILLRVTNTEITPVVTIGIYWALALTVIGIAVSGEGLSLPDLGFRRPALVDLGYILVTSVSILFVYIVTPPLIEAVGLPVSEGAGTMGAGVGIGMALAQSVTVGIVEEILYRGYPIERLLAYTESSLVAGGITWIAFTVAHALNWPLGSLLQTALVAAVLTVVYLRRRTLVPVAGAHVLVWVFAALGQFYA